MKIFAMLNEQSENIYIITIRKKFAIANENLSDQELKNLRYGSIIKNLFEYL